MYLPLKGTPQPDFGWRIVRRLWRILGLSASQKCAQRKNPFAEVETLYHICNCMSRVFFIFSFSPDIFFFPIYNSPSPVDVGRRKKSKKSGGAARKRAQSSPSRVFYCFLLLGRTASVAPRSTQSIASIEYPPSRPEQPSDEGCAVSASVADSVSIGSASIGRVSITSPQSVQVFRSSPATPGCGASETVQSEIVPCPLAGTVVCATNT